jgi:hypothetical protein
MAHHLLDVKLVKRRSRQAQPQPKEHHPEPGLPDHVSRHLSLDRIAIEMSGAEQAAALLQKALGGQAGGHEEG